MHRTCMSLLQRISWPLHPLNTFPMEMLPPISVGKVHKHQKVSISPLFLVADSQDPSLNLSNILITGIGSNLPAFLERGSFLAWHASHDLTHSDTSLYIAGHQYFSLSHT